MIDPTATMGQIAAVRDDRVNEINSELQILKSRDLFETTVSKMGVKAFEKVQNEAHGTNGSDVKSYLQRIKEFPSKTTEKMAGFIRNYLKIKEEGEPEQFQRQMETEKIVDQLMDNFEAQSVTDSNVITLYYDDQSPERAQQVLQELIKNYLVKHMAVYRTSGSYQFFDQQAEKLKNTLLKTGKSLKEIKNQTGIASLDQQRTLLLERIDALKRESEENEASLAAMEEKVAALRRELDRTPKTVVQTQTTNSPYSAIEELRRQIYLLRLQEQELLSKFAEQAVPVREIRRRIHSAESILSKAQSSRQIMTGNNSTYQQLDMNMLLAKSDQTALKAKAQKLKTQLTQAGEELRKLNDRELQINELQREMEIHVASYKKYADSKEQSRIDNALETGKISNISIAQPCTIPVAPIRPKRVLNLSIGLILALGGGIGLAFFLEYLDHTYSVPEDIEKKLGLPALGSLPKLSTDGLRELGLADGAARYYLPTETVRSLSTEDESHVPKLQSVQDIPTDLVPDDSSSRTIAVTSSRKGEGTSTVSFYLASMLVHHFGCRVLLIDANFQDPAIHKMLGGSPSPGLAEILSQKRFEAKEFQPTSLEGLDFIAAGEKHPPYLRWGEKKSLGKLLHSLKQKYDFVVVDSPPLWNGSGPESSNFESMADSVVLVVEAEKVKWEVTQRARDRLLKMDANILGAVLNKRCYHIPKWLYTNL